MIDFLLAKLLDWLLSRCTHPDYGVKADILEGELNSRQVQWCEKCGAFRRVRMAMSSSEKKQLGEWRRPQPMWGIEREKSIEAYKKVAKQSKEKL